MLLIGAGVGAGGVSVGRSRSKSNFIHHCIFGASDCFRVSGARVLVLKNCSNVFLGRFKRLSRAFFVRIKAPENSAHVRYRADDSTAGKRGKLPELNF